MSWLDRAVIEGAGLNGDIPTDQRDTRSLHQCESTALNGDHSRIRAKESKRSDRQRSQQSICCCVGDCVESRVVCEFEIGGAGEGHQPADMHGRVRPKQESGRVHEKEVGVPEAGGLDGAIDAREYRISSVRSSDACKDVGGLQASRKRTAVEVERYTLRKFAMLLGGTPN